jgi:putative ABC transport system permease protein
MRTTALVAHSLRALARYKLRSAFMMLGTLIGIAALTLVTSVGAGAERKMLATMRQLFGASSIVIQAGGTHFMGGPRADAARLTIDDVDAIVNELAGIEVWDPQQSLPAAAVRRDEVNVTARVLGQSERSERAWNRSVSRGEYFDAAAVKSSARVALIGETVAADLFGTEEPLEAEILIDSVAFKVIGILEPLGTDVHGMDRDNEIVVPISTLMRRLMNTDTISTAKLLVNDPQRVEETGHEIARLLRARHGVADGRPDDFTLITAVEVQRMADRVERILRIYLPLVAAVALLVGGIVAAALMLASVSERVGEIGLRRAVGARTQDIRLQFLMETAATTLTGGIAGVLLGYGGAQLAANRMHLGDIFSWEAVLLGIAAAALTGLLAGVVPAQRAAHLRPADALR